MQLMTKELEARFKKIGSQDGIDNPVVVAKYFNPTGGQNWYATEYNPVSKCFFGYASLFGDYNDEWGYFSLEELESIKGQFGLGIERDLYCGEKKLNDHNIPSLSPIE